MANRCGTGRKRSATLQETVKHHWQNHKESAVCGVRPIWDAENGTHVYQTLNYKVTPEAPQPNQPKLSGTPVRCTTAQKVSFDVQEQLNETIGHEQDEQTDLLCDSLADMSLENRHLVQKLNQHFP